MPIEYNPKDAEKAWPEGNYPAELTYVKDTMTKEKPGKPATPMQEWNFAVYDDANNRQQNLTDYFVPPGSTFKLRQLAAALGKADLFERNEFQADDVQGSRVMLALVVEKSDQYGDKNKIRSISAIPGQAIARRPAAAATRPAAQTRRMDAVPAGSHPADAEAPITEDDIPF